MSDTLTPTPQIPPSEGPDYTADHPFRTLVLGQGELGSPDGSARPIMPPFAEVEYVEDDGFEVANEDTRRWPEDGEHPRIAPDGELYLGNHQVLDASEFHDYRDVEELLSNKNYHFSRKARRRAIEQIKNRTRRILTRVKFAKEGPPKPPNLSTEAAERLKPTDQERPPSRLVFSIDVNKLNKALQSGETTVTLDEMEDWLQNTHKADRRDPDNRYDKFLKTPQKEVTEQEESTGYDKALLWLSVKMGKKINHGTPFELESLDSADNTAAQKLVNETVANADDTYVRAALKFSRNENGVFTDPDGKALSEGMVVQVRQEMIELIKKQPAYLHALLSYETTKRVPDEIPELIQEAFDLAMGAGMDENIMIGHMIGYFYEQKVKFNKGKNSNLVNPVKRYESGPYKGLEMWETLRVGEGKHKGKAYLEDVDGNPVHPADVETDEGSGDTYHYKRRKDGSFDLDETTKQKIPVPIAYARKRNPDGSLVYKTNPDGSYVENPVIDETTGDQLFDEEGNPIMSRVVDYGPVEHQTPVYEKNKFVIGPLKLREYAIEMGDRFKAGEFMFEFAAMTDLLNTAVEIVEKLDESLYLPGFHEQKGYDFDDIRGRVNRRRPLGRDSQDYQEALFALNKFWDVCQMLKQTYGDMGDDADPALAEAIQRQNDMYGRMDPRFYQGSGSVNQLLKKFDEVVQAGAKRHPAATVGNVGDSQLIGPNNSGQDVFGY
jgi:hypothetical protein